jgi:hypothetical protein
LESPYNKHKIKKPYKKKTPVEFDHLWPLKSLHKKTKICALETLGFSIHKNEERVREKRREKRVVISRAFFLFFVKKAKKLC